MHVCTTHAPRPLYMPPSSRWCLSRAPCRLTAFNYLKLYLTSVLHCIRVPDARTDGAPIAIAGVYLWPTPGFGVSGDAPSVWGCSPMAPPICGVPTLPSEEARPYLGEGRASFTPKPR